MKKEIYATITVMLLLFCLNSCKSNPTSPTNTTTNSSNSASSYYPNGDGTSYKYSVVRTDSVQNKTTGTRTVNYSGTTDVGTVTYQNEFDTTTFSALVNATHTLFVKDSNGVSLMLDTTGFFDIIPATYKPFISFSPTIKIFQSSFLNGTPWTVFDLSLKEGALSIDLVNVVASFMDNEQVSLSLSSGTVTQTAAKVQYTIKLNIPNASNPLAGTVSSTYTAYAWFANNIGIVQIQGNATLLDAFTGNGINFADTTSSITQSLVNYNIK
ncbi:MAG: hypothetical protein WCA84_07950 [Ignavibacteriaceae bacterium]